MRDDKMAGVNKKGKLKENRLGGGERKIPTGKINQLYKHQQKEI